jgi:predicted MFS family arabinose efflux permease
MKPVRAMPYVVVGLFGLYTLEFGPVGLLPVIIARFHVTVSEAGLLMSLFALTVAVCGPLLVLLSSRFDRKKVLIAALVVFTASGMLWAIAPNFRWLIALRIVPALLHPVFYAAALSTAVSLYPPAWTGPADASQGHAAACFHSCF